MERIPILRVRGILLVSIQVDLTDSLVGRLQEDVLSSLEKRPARGVVIDVSGVDVLDTFTARCLAQLSSMALLMGTRTIVVGLAPAIALTLIEMGFASKSFETALDIDSALDRLELAEQQA